MSCPEIRQWATALKCIIVSLPKRCFDIFPVSFEGWGEQKVEVINHQH